MTTQWIVGVALIGGFLAFGRLRTIGSVSPVQLPSGADTEPLADHPHGRDLTIVIPARNEEASLANLLGDLGIGRPIGSRVIVVDDHSTDHTAEIARSFDFVDLITAPDLPDGWCGKPWACHTGAADATTGRLMFLDADVRVDPGALDVVLEQHDRHHGIVSVQPWHQVIRAYEQVSALFNVIAIMGAGAGRPMPTGVFGPVIVTSVTDYQVCGGHAAVRDAVVEDLALCRRYQDDGRAVTVLGGHPSIRFRMYPVGVSQLVEGWTKNFATGAVSTSLRWLAVIFAWVTALLSITIQLVEQSIGRGDVPLWTTALLYIAAVVQLTVLFRRVGNFSVFAAVLFPLLLLFFFMTFACSVYRTAFRRTVIWRGREIPIRRHRSHVESES